MLKTPSEQLFLNHPILPSVHGENENHCESEYDFDHAYGNRRFYVTMGSKSFLSYKAKGGKTTTIRPLHDGGLFQKISRT